MKTSQASLYLEYQDSSFWAIHTEGADWFTTDGSRYEDFWPELMLKAGTLEAEQYRMPPNVKQ